MALWAAYQPSSALVILRMLKARLNSVAVKCLSFGSRYAYVCASDTATFEPDLVLKTGAEEWRPLLLSIWSSRVGLTREA